MPATLLKHRLAEQGLALDFGAPPFRILPPLTGEIEIGSAFQLFGKVRRAVEGCDLDELTYDPWPEDWGTYLLPAPLPENGIWLPATTLKPIKRPNG